MAIGSVILYDSAINQISDTANRQWNNATTGNIMFCLCSSAYTPAFTHTTTTDLGASVITAGDGAPVAATTLLLDSASVAGSTFFDSADVDFTLSGTITPKYLVCVQPTTANTFSATTSLLLFYVDLNTTSGSATQSMTAGTYTIYAPYRGWFKTTTR
jgi:hypothetical protein